MQMNEIVVGSKVKWQGQEVKVVSTNACGLPNVIGVELASGEGKYVNINSVTASTPPVKTVTQLHTYTQQVITAVRNALAYGNREEVMALLRVLRGPDNGGQAYKRQTTGVLRHLILGDKAASFGDVSSDVESLRNTSFSALRTAHGEHFAMQVRNAAKVFGIDLKA